MYNIEAERAVWHVPARDPITATRPKAEAQPFVDNFHLATIFNSSVHQIEKGE